MHAVTIRITDDGPGLPAGQESRVFEKFYRGNVAATDSRRGVGLGLAICKAIVVAHGGEITAANHLTRGAEFVIRLPIPENPPTVALEGNGYGVSNATPG
jgi:two-component system sensor histidine kinase KdpD